MWHMISRRKISEEYPTDELDSLIRWALRERVAGATPPPRVWRRINERLKSRIAVNELGLWERFCVTYRSVADRLGRGNISYTQSIPLSVWDRVERQNLLFVLAYQCGMPMLAAKGV